MPLRRKSEVREVFTKDSERKVYIYGAGKYAGILHKYMKLIGKKIEAFLISDEQEKVENEIENIPVMWLSKLAVEELQNANIYVAVGKQCWDNILLALKKKLSDSDENIYFVTDDEILEMFRKVKPVREEDFLTSLEPVSRLFGCDRGTPIDRYYINNFLRRESIKLSDVEMTFEVGEDTYSRAYFPNANHEILDYGKGMDLTKKTTLPSGKYDVFVCTQVFNFIYDIEVAIKGAYEVLKPTGVLLATVAGNISQVSRSDMENYGDYWRFTYLSIQKLVEEVFGKGNVRVEAFGNPIAATAFIQGIVVEEMPNVQLLDCSEEDYAICIGIVARK